MTDIYPRDFIGDLGGKPLDNGAIYVGVANQDPQTNPVQCYWDAALTVPASQPISVYAGYPVNAGSRADVYTASSSYSIRVRDKSGAQVDYIASVPNGLLGSSGAGSVGFSHSATYAAGTLGAKAKQAIDPRDAPFNAVWNGVADDAVALQAALTYAVAQGAPLYLPASPKDGVVLIGSTITIPDDDVTIIGVGAASLTIKFTGTGALFSALARSADALVNISGFTAMAGATNCGRPIDIAYTSSSGLDVRTCLIDDVTTTSNTADPTKYWTGGPRISNARNSIFLDCYTLGPTTDLTRTIDGFSVTGQATDVKFANCQTVSVGTGVDITGTVEGTMLTNFVAVDVNIGVSKVHSGGGKPWLSMNGNWHINTRSRGIYLQGALQVTVGLGLLYAQNATAPWIGVEIASGGGTNNDIMIDALIDGQLAVIAASNLTGMSVAAGNGIAAQLKLRALGTGVNIASGVTNCLIAIDPASDVTTICTGTGLNTSSNRVVINDPSNGYLLPSPMSAANLDASATANKTSAVGVFGRDTTGVFKPGAQMVATSVDANWVNSTLSLNVRRGDALVTGMVLFGTGTPEGAVTAPVGSLYTRNDGSTSTTLYVKTSGTGNTGWTAK